MVASASCFHKYLQSTIFWSTIPQRREMPQVLKELWHRLPIRQGQCWELHVWKCLKRNSIQKVFKNSFSSLKGSPTCYFLLPDNRGECLICIVLKQRISKENFNSIRSLGPLARRCRHMNRHHQGHDGCSDCIQPPPFSLLPPVFSKALSWGY